MKVSPAKENILKKIRKALSHSTPLPFPNSEGNSSLFKAPSQEPELEFAERFGKLLGKFIFCADEKECIEQLKTLVNHHQWQEVYCREKKWSSKLTSHLSQLVDRNLAGCDAAITTCELLVARTGTIVMSAAQESGRTVSVYAPVHICIAYTSQLVFDIKDGLQALKDKYAGNLPSLITFATGPSRTADIEKTLVVGVHGPKEVYLMLIDEPPQATNA